MNTLIPLALGVIFGLLIACIVAVIIADKPNDMVKKPMMDAELTPAQAVFKLQEIKPYYAYKGRTWTALDMAIKALQEGENADSNRN